MDNDPRFGEPARIGISEPTDLLAAIPVLLGFHPAESLVVVAVNGPRARLGPVLRIDLPRSRDRDAALAHLVSATVRHAEKVALVGYSATRPISATLRELRRRVRLAGLPLIDTIAVDAQGATSIDDGQVRRTVPLPAPDDRTFLALSGAAALSGRIVLDSRNQLAASIAGPLGPSGTALAERAVEAAVDELAAEFGRHGPDAPADLIGQQLTEAALAALQRAVGQHQDSHVVGPTVAARLAVAMQHVNARDAVAATVLSDRLTEWVPILISTCASLPDDSAADCCVVLAIAAYRCGDGALAQVALDRCLLAEPGHRLGGLLLLALSGGIRPEELDALAGLAPTAADPLLNPATLRPGAADVTDLQPYRSRYLGGEHS